MRVELIEATDDPEKVICKAARNDYMSDWVGGLPFDEIMGPVNGDSTDEKVEELITHMMTRGHFGVFEHVSATFAIEGISRACMAQLTRHRHATFDIQSMRYVKFDEMEPGEAVVEIPELEDPGTSGRNGQFDIDSDGYTDDQILMYRRELYTLAIERAFDSYQSLLVMGVAPEHARMVLPIGTKVNMVVTLNARMLMHVADMRAAGDAQGEIRELTNAILDEAEEWCPTVFSVYRERLHGRKNRLAP